MSIKTLLTLRWQLGVCALKSSFDGGTRKTSRPVRINRAVAVSGDLERIVKGNVELLICELIQSVRVVGVARPWSVGEVEKEGRVLCGVAAEECWLFGEIQADHGVDVWDVGERDVSLLCGKASVCNQSTFALSMNRRKTY